VLDGVDEIAENQLEQCELLGSGAFAEVYKGWWKRPVAIKKFRRVTRQDQVGNRHNILPLIRRRMLIAQQNPERLNEF
jgi:serine/threonine protein kinase